LQEYYGDYYLPLHRVQEGGEAKGWLAGSRLVNLPPVVRRRSAKGSGRAVVDPVEATIARTIYFSDRAAKARVMESLRSACDPAFGGVEGMGGLMDRVDPKRIAHKGTIKEILTTLVDEGVIEADEARDMRIASRLREGDDVTQKSMAWFANRHGIDLSDRDSDVQIARAVRGVPDALAMISLWRPDFSPDGKKRIILTHDKGGNPLLYEMDPFLHETATAMSEPQFAAFLQPFRLAAKLFKQGSVSLSTGFGSANIVRDYSEYQGKSEHAGPVESLLSPLAKAGQYIGYKARQMAGMKTNSALIDTFENIGGELYNILGYDTGSHRRLSTRKLGKSTMSRMGLTIKKPGDIVGAAGDAIQSGMDVLASPIAWTDVPPRLAEMEAAIREEGYEARGDKWYDAGKDVLVDSLPEDVRIKAAMAAGEATIFFKRIGAKSSFIEPFLPFFNATIQAQYRQYRQIKKLPSLFRKGPAEKGALRYIVYLSAMAASGAAYWMWRSDDDDYREQEPWLKEGYWTWGKNGRTYVRIPKPRDTGATVANFVEAALDVMHHKDAQGTMKMLQRDVLNRLPVGGGLTRGIVEAGIANYDYFRGREIEPDYMQSRPKALRYDQYTTEASKLIGRIAGPALGISPLQLEHLLNSATGGMYRRLSDTFDAIHGGRVGPEHIPFVRGLVLNRHQARSLNDFYNAKTDINMQAQMEEAEGGVTKATARKRATMSRYAELMAEIRLLEKGGEKESKRTFDYQRYLVGLARAAMEYEPLEENPNPLKDKDLPPELAKVIRKYRRKHPRMDALPKMKKPRKKAEKQG
jgi:hypothetical protein